MNGDYRFELVNTQRDPEQHDRKLPAGNWKVSNPPDLCWISRNQPHISSRMLNLLIAINMALTVGAPLLLTGEPGTGKTTVAYYLAWYFDDLPLFDYQVRSTSTADDMKYDFDAVAYLRSAQHPP
ncbi:MAG: AAA family ATPase [Desulfobacterales bacterium]|nr:AAA family ATPase [Desulfobacterales bacterium]